MVGRTVDEVFRDQVQRKPDAPFINCGDGWVTFAQLDERTDRLAAGLARLGVQVGDRIALVIPNRIEMVELLLAAAKLGVVQVPLNYWLKGEFLRYQLDDCGARVLVADSLGYAAAEPLLGGTKIESVVLLDEPRGEHGPSHPREDESMVEVVSYADVISGDGEPSWPRRRPRPSDLLAILYTSGTTALPKGCMLSTGYYVSVGRSYGQRGWIVPNDRVYTAFPLFHSSGQMVAFMSALVNDASIIFAPEFHASTFMTDAHAAGATTLMGIGVMAQMLLEQPVRPQDADYRFRLAVWVPLPVKQQERFEKRFHTPVIAEGYGQTECVPISASEVGGPRKRTSSGQIAPLVEVRIVDENDDEVPVGEVGEVVVRPRVPEATFQGYWNKPEETFATWKGLWHHTGDLGRLDADGFLSFVGRAKDMIRRRGENISALQLEDAIREHPAIADVAVYAVPSPLGDEDIKACVVVEPGATLTPSDFFEFLRDRIPYFAMPRFVQLRSELPVNAMGRVMKHLLRAEGASAADWDLELLGLVIPHEERRGYGRPTDGNRARHAAPRR